MKAVIEAREEAKQSLSTLRETVRMRAEERAAAQPLDTPPPDTRSGRLKNAYNLGRAVMLWTIAIAVCDRLAAQFPLDVEAWSSARLLEEQRFADVRKTLLACGFSVTLRI